MKKTSLFVGICLAFVSSTHAQKWSDLSKEEKVMKAKEFRADNQKYLKDSLAMTEQQTTDIDNVNLCFLSTLDRIDRYAKDQATKEKYAKALWDVRWAQVDVIMGEEKHKRYAQYIANKLKKAGAK
jgi:hypothetical protein